MVLRTLQAYFVGGARRFLPPYARCRLCHLRPGNRLTNEIETCQQIAITIHCPSPPCLIQVVPRPTAQRKRWATSAFRSSSPPSSMSSFVPPPQLLALLPWHWSAPVTRVGLAKGLPPANRIRRESRGYNDDDVDGADGDSSSGLGPSIRIQLDDAPLAEPLPCPRQRHRGTASTTAATASRARCCPWSGAAGDNYNNDEWNCEHSERRARSRGHAAAAVASVAGLAIIVQRPSTDRP